MWISKLYLSQIHNQIIGINNQIKAEAAKVSTDDENTVANLSDSLLAFSSLVTNHGYFSEILNILASLTYSKVDFIRFDADKDKGIITLKGYALSYTALAKQIVALRDYKDIKSVDVKGINFTDLGLTFELTLGVSPQLFIKQQ